MNNHRRLFVLSIIVFVLFALAISPVNAKAVKTYFTGTEIYLYDTDPGRQWVTPAGTYHIRDNTGLGYIETSDPRVGGDNHISLNGNFTFVPEPVFVTGQMWGTFRLVNAGGAWEGTFTGMRDEQGSSWFKYVAKGTGGYEGLQLRMDYERLDPDPTVAAVNTGYVIEKAP